MKENLFFDLAINSPHSRWDLRQQRRQTPFFSRMWVSRRVNDCELGSTIKLDYTPTQKTYTLFQHRFGRRVPHGKQTLQKVYERVAQFGTRLNPPQVRRKRKLSQRQQKKKKQDDGESRNPRGTTSVTSQETRILSPSSRRARKQRLDTIIYTLSVINPN